MKFFKDSDDNVFAYDEEQVKQGLADGKTEITEAKKDELTYIAPPKVQVVSMRQARLALLQLSLLNTIEDAITNGTDEAMKIEWEYATEVRRDWDSLISLSETLGMTSDQLDDLFQLASTL